MVAQSAMLIAFSHGYFQTLELRFATIVVEKKSDWNLWRKNDA
jgi:hypothetical protein